MDFQDFLNEVNPAEGDFLFIDLPMTLISQLCQNTFDQDQIRLANYLRSIKASFMIVIKNTDFILFI